MQVQPRHARRQLARQERRQTERRLAQQPLLLRRHDRRLARLLLALPDLCGLLRRLRVGRWGRIASNCASGYGYRPAVFWFNGLGCR